MTWQKFVFHFFEELAQPCWYLEGPKNGGWNWLPMLAVLRNQSLAYTSGFSLSKRGRKRRRPNEKFFCDSRKKWNFSPPKYSNAPLLGERESRLPDFLLRFIRQNLLSQSFLHCSLLTLSNAMVHVDYQSTQRVDSESIPWLHRSRFALVLTGAFWRSTFLMRSRRSCWVQIGNIYSLWTDMEPHLGRFLFSSYMIKERKGCTLSWLCVIAALSWKCGIIITRLNQPILHLQHTMNTRMKAINNAKTHS